MEKEFVPYELAVKLKTLGFDEPCFGIYLMKEFRYSSPPMTLENTTKGIELLAPTFSQAFRWFREKHGICSWIERLYTENSVAYYKTNQEYKKDASSKMHNLIISLKEYNTYEEAELECLKKLIEIVKQKIED